MLFKTLKISIKYSLLNKYAIVTYSTIWCIGNQWKRIFIVKPKTWSKELLLQEQTEHIIILLSRSQLQNGYWKSSIKFQKILNLNLILREKVNIAQALKFINLNHQIWNHDFVLSGVSLLTIRSLVAPLLQSLLYGLKHRIIYNRIWIKIFYISNLWFKGLSRTIISID